MGRLKKKTGESMTEIQSHSIKEGKDLGRNPMCHIHHSLIQLQGFEQLSNEGNSTSPVLWCTSGAFPHDTAGDEPCSFLYPFPTEDLQTITPDVPEFRIHVLTFSASKPLPPHNPLLALGVWFSFGPMGTPRLRAARAREAGLGGEGEGRLQLTSDSTYFWLPEPGCASPTLL